MIQMLKFYFIFLNIINDKRKLKLCMRNIFCTYTNIYNTDSLIKIIALITAMTILS